jgi:hypothetical protein
VHSIWQDEFSLSIAKIEYESEFADSNSIEEYLQDMIHSSGVGSSGIIA